MKSSVLLDNETKPLTVAQLNKKINNPKILVVGFTEHTKASEKYVVIHFPGAQGKKWMLPYQYRRTNVLIGTVDELKEFIVAAIACLNDKTIESFKTQVDREVDEIFGKKANVTKPIFRKLLANCGKWVCNKEFRNPNSQRRIQDIKEKGFTIVTEFGEQRSTYHQLLPFERGVSSGYETIDIGVRKRIFQVLGNLDAFTGRKVGASTLPDHKFPEIRWDHETAETNSNLSDSDIQKKFQLIPESANQAKREVCRNCSQTKQRGLVQGINFFYEGGRTWPTDVPERGKDAESGCVGCFWYDMKAWRIALNKLLSNRTT